MRMTNLTMMAWVLMCCLAVGPGWADEGLLGPAVGDMKPDRHPLLDEITNTRPSDATVPVISFRGKKVMPTSDATVPPITFSGSLQIEPAPDIKKQIQPAGSAKPALQLQGEKAGLAITSPQTGKMIPGKTIQPGKALAVKRKTQPMPLSAAKVKPAVGLSPQASLTPAGIPVIVSPTENQHLPATGPLMIRARLADAGADLVWEVEHQPFGSPRYAADRRQPTASPAAGASHTYSGRLALDAPGHYRLRARVDAPGARWSQWRTVVVGTAPVVKSVAAKPALKKTAVRPAAPAAGGASAGADSGQPAAGATVLRPATPAAPAGPARVTTPTPGHRILQPAQ